MVCGICGKEISGTSKFCPFCGGKVSNEYNGVKEEWNSVVGESAQTSTDNTEYTDSEEYGDNGAARNHIKYERMQSQSEYSLADMPVKKKRHKRKRPFWLAAICTAFSILFAWVLFSLCLTLLYCTVFSRAASDVMSVYSSNSTNFSEIPVGQILNRFDSSGDYEDDVTLSEYVYDKLPAKDKENTTEEDIAEMIDNPSISEFVGEVMDDYMKVMTGRTDEASISNDRILQVVRENEKLVETAIGRDLSESDYRAIESKLDEANFEENTTISNHHGDFADDLPAIRSVYKIMDNPTLVFVGLGIAIGVILFIILLLNLHKPYVVFRYLGVCTVLAAGIGYATGAVFNWAINELGERERVSFNMVLGLMGNPQNRIMTNSTFFLIAGIVLIAAYIVIAVLLKTVSGRE